VKNFTCASCSRVLIAIVVFLSVSHGPHEASPILIAPTYSAMDGDPVDLATGLYVRTTVDLVLVDTIPVVFARTYRNRDDRSRPFGIGTNHSFGSFLIGDAPALTYVDLILPDGGRIHYRRISAGTGVTGAVFEHTSTPSEYRDSRLFWDDGKWTIQLRDGGVYTYPACSPSLNKPCTVSSYRDPDGNQLRMQHDRRMNLIRIETPNGAAIYLTYDAGDRIVSARTSYDQQVDYRYDAQGRLVRATSSDGPTATYAYDERHQMVQVDEPGVSVTNTFDAAGRCILNDVRLETTDRLGRTQTQRTLFKFAYTVSSTGRISATEVERPGNRRRVTFNEQGYSLTDTEAATGGTETGATYERNDISNVVQRLMVWCGSDRRRVKVEAAIDPEGSAASIERQLQNTCATAAGGR
jgi:YD repeat-containing protein